MIYKLQENDYKKLQPLFQDLRYNLVVDSVIAGNTLAWVSILKLALPNRSKMALAPIQFFYYDDR